MTTSIALPATSKNSLFSFVALFLGAAALALGGVFLRHSELPPTASAVYRVALAIPIFFLLDMLAARSEPAQPAERRTLKPVKLIHVGFIF